MVGVPGRAGPAGVTGVGRGLEAALLHTRSHLRDRVASDTRTDACGRVCVILYDRGEHGDVVALGANYRVLDDCSVPGFGGQRLLQTLFWSVPKGKGF